MPKSAWEMFWYTIKPYKKAVFFMWILIFVGNTLAFSVPYFLKLIADYAVEVDPSLFLFAEISFAFYGVAAVLVLQEVFYRIAHILDVYLNINTFDRVNTSLFSLLVRRPSFYFENKFSGQLTKRIDQISTSTKHFVENFPWEAAWAVPALLVSSVLLYIASPSLFYAFAIWFFIFWFISYFLLKRLYSSSEAVWERGAVYDGQLVDSVSNISLVHSFASEQYEKARLRTTIVSNREALAAEGFWFVINKFQQGIGVVLLTILLIWLSLQEFAAGNMTIGDFVLVAGVLPSITAVFWHIGDMILQALRNWSGLMDAVNDLQTETESLPEGKKELQASKKDIIFSNVNFVYPTVSEKIFSDFNLVIRPGQKVGVVGSSGAGKTTLVKLLLRHYDPDSGVVSIGDESIREFTLESVRREIAFVPQDTTLFHRSIFENIQYAKPDASLAEVIEASERAHTHDFIQTLPEQYDTTVGERGVKLSGGQRQRIAIARAMLKDAPILVLDEATSALDGESERIVQAGFKELFSGRTVIAVAHRLSTLKEMDRIIVIENGNILEDGTPKDLLHIENGIFKQKWEQQKDGFV